MAEGLHIVELAERSDTGRVRDHNEDRSYVAAHVVAVADGMGGALAGEVASQMAVEAIEGISKPADPLSIKAAIENANRAIRRMAAQDPSKSGMGTTITAATLEGHRLDVVHVGDSRAYLWRGDTLEQLTHDHSVVAELVRQGSLSPEEALNHPHRNVITRALGAEPDVTVDTYQHDVEPDDILLLCSDGLYGEVSDDEILAELRTATSMEEAAAALVARANANGGSDNVTVVLARIGEGSPTQATSATLSSDTQEIPVDEPESVPRGGRPDRATKVIGGVPAGGGDGATGAPLVFERAPGRGRGRHPGLWVAGVVALAVILGGAFWWFQGRSYSLAAGGGDTIWVERGVALGPIDTSHAWEDTGVPATPGLSLGGFGGLGETVLRATRLVWTQGLPDAPTPRAQLPRTGPPGLGPLTNAPQEPAAP
ncbi:MAG: Stp1/IreP family PP2C-type Ser/Thr phosphatase [Thermoleophilia bacterium]|nr:Stp1/IreP family PP2C-type Ser/Thr phosphatase [Thermoleophilia bacterium]